MMKRKKSVFICRTGLDQLVLSQYSLFELLDNIVMKKMPYLLREKAY